MNLTPETSIPAITVFLQGILSFFSPCVLPLIPLYIGYLSGGAGSMDENGNFSYKRSRILRNTLFFVLGISFAFFLLGLGFTAAGRFFHNYQIWFTRIGGIAVILFGLYQLGLFGDTFFQKEHRIPFHPDTLAMNPLTALVLGFTFSFAWTPCVGPALASVLLLAASTTSAPAGFTLIGIYTLGFVLPFMGVGIFTGSLLQFFREHNSVVKYTVKAGGILMLLIGAMMLAGWIGGNNADSQNDRNVVSGPGSNEPSDSFSNDGSSNSFSSDGSSSNFSSDRPSDNPDSNDPGNANGRDGIAASDTNDANYTTDTVNTPDSPASTPDGDSNSTANEANPKNSTKHNASKNAEERNTENSTENSTEHSTDSNTENGTEHSTDSNTETNAPTIPAPDFTLNDQYGNTHTLSAYKGKTIFLNFWATWCPPCRAEMPEIQEIYEEYGENTSDVIILGIAGPNYGREGSAEDIAEFLSDNGYSYPVVMDEGGLTAYFYGINAYPTTFMIDKDGNVFGYVTGQITKDIMESIIEQTMNGA